MFISSVHQEKGDIHFKHAPTYPPKYLPQGQITHTQPHDSYQPSSVECFPKLIAKYVGMLTKQITDFQMHKQHQTTAKIGISQMWVENHSYIAINMRKTQNC